MAPRKHQELLMAAIERDGRAQQALLDGRFDAARAEFMEAAALYRQSWEVAPPRAYGRLVGVLKSSLLAGDGGAAEAEYVRGELAGADPESATAGYALALAALIAGDDAEAGAFAQRMGSGSDAFGRTAEAIAALAAHDQAGYGSALEAIVRDFEERSDHLTGVAIADTAVMLQRLAARRGMEAAIESPVLPAGE